MYIMIWILCRGQTGADIRAGEPPDLPSSYLICKYLGGRTKDHVNVEHMAALS